MSPVARSCDSSTRADSRNDLRRLFGTPGSRYDFQGVNLPQIRKQCGELEAQQKAASRKVNNKVMSMIDRLVESSSVQGTGTDP